MRFDKTGPIGDVSLGRNLSDKLQTKVLLWRRGLFGKLSISRAHSIDKKLPDGALMDR